jgi:hypothetical protein
MLWVTSNKERQLLYLNFAGRVQPEELQRGYEDLKALLADLQPGFRILADLSRMESMDLACTPELGRAMELMDKHGVGMVVRVLPDEALDIGFNILAIFHYKHPPQIVACKTIAEAGKVLRI